MHRRIRLGASACATVRLLAALQIDIGDEYKPYLEKVPLPKK